MAGAYDTAVKITNGNQAVTVASANSVVVVDLWVWNLGGGATSVTGVTCGGNAMTYVAGPINFNGNANTAIWTYIISGVAAGSQTIAVTSGNQYWGTISVYNGFGAAQPGGITQASFGVSGTTQTITPIDTTNAWAHYAFAYFGQWAATFNGSLRLTNADVNAWPIQTYDSNGVIGASFGATISGSNPSGYTGGFIGISIEPVPTGPTGVKTWDGVAQSTGIKTYMGVAVASTKSVNGIT